MRKLENLHHGHAAYHDIPKTKIILEEKIVFSSNKHFLVFLSFENERREKKTL